MKTHFFTKNDPNIINKSMKNIKEMSFGELGWSIVGSSVFKETGGKAPESPYGQR